MRTTKRKKTTRLGVSVFFAVSWTACLFLIGSGPTLAAGQSTTQTPSSIPAPGELHIPPNTRVVEGMVTASNGQPLSSATVLLKDTKTLQIRSYLSRQDGSYRFYGLSTDVNYEIRAETGNLTSPIKQISVFNSHKLIKVNLKIKDKLKK